MPKSKEESELEQRLGELQKEHGDTIKVEEIAKVVKGLVASLKSDLAETDTKLYSELESLSRYIQETKAEISALRPDEVKEELLPSATDELDAIIKATAEATDTIMDATESIEVAMESIEGEANNKLLEATTLIYEACGFQDITGQRITKVVKALKDIEEKVDALLSAFGSEFKNVKAREPKKKKKDQPLSDEDLLQGPQNPDKAKSQEEIDALLASFD